MVNTVACYFRDAKFGPPRGAPCYLLCTGNFKHGKCGKAISSDKAGNAVRILCKAPSNFATGYRDRNMSVWLAGGIAQVIIANREDIRSMTLIDRNFKNTDRREM